MAVEAVYFEPLSGLTIPANREISREFAGDDARAKCGTSTFIAVFA